MNSWFHYLNNPRYYAKYPEVEDHRCASFAEFLRRPASPFLLHSYSLKGNFSNVVERWAEHVKGWIDATDTPVVRYEDLKVDPSKVIREVASFLGLKLRRKIQSVALEGTPSVFINGRQVFDHRARALRLLVLRAQGMQADSMK